MNFRIAISFLLMLLLLGLGQLAAADTHLKVGVYQNKPKVFVDQEGNAQGFFIDIIEYIAGVEGWTVEYVPGNWEQCLERLRAGEIDLMVDIAFSEERAEIYDYQNLTVVNNWAQLYVRGEDIPSILDLEGKKVGVLTGDISYQRFQEQLELFGVEVEFVEVKKFIDIFQMLEEHSVDAGLISRLFGVEYEGDFSAERSPIICCPMELRFAAPKGKNRLVLDVIDQHLAELKVDKGSEYYQAQERWLGEEFSMATPIPHWIWWTLGSLAAFALILFLHHNVLHARLHFMTAELRKKNTALEGEIQDRVKAEEELRNYQKHLEEMVEDRTRDLSESRTKYKLLADNVSDTIWTMDLNTRFTYVSPSGFRMSGYTVEEMKGKTLADMLTPASLAVAMQSMQERFEDPDAPDTVSLELEMIKKDGTTIWAGVSSTIMRDEEGNVTGLLGVTRDISDRKAAEEALRVSEEKFRNIVESSPMGMHMYHLEEDDRLVFVGSNPASDRILGMDNTQFEGMTIEEAFPGITMTEVPDKYREVASTGKPWQTQEVSYEDEKIRGAFEVHAFQTAPGKMTAAFLDITDRQRAEEALKESEERYRSIFENATMGIFRTTPGGRVLTANPATAKMMRYDSVQEVLDTVTNLSEQVYENPKDRQKVLEMMQEKGQASAEVRLKRKDGTSIDAQLKMWVVQDEDGGVRFIEGFIDDITARKEAEEKIKIYQRIFMSTSDGIAIYDMEGYVIDMNPSMEKALGMSVDEIRGKHPDEFSPMEHKETMIKEIEKQVRESGEFRGEASYLTKDDTRTYADLSVFPITHKDGSGCLVGIGRDITERKEAEEKIKKTNQELQTALKDLKATQTHLVQSEKMASLGRLVAGVAHEFNNPIGAVQSSNDTLKNSIGRLVTLCAPIVEEKVPEKKQLAKLMKVIRDANQVIENGTERVALIVRRMKAFARLDEADWQLADLHQCINDSLHSLPRGWDERITIRRDFGELPMVACYPAQVNQVLHTVLNNAGAAIEGKGEIRIETAVAGDDVVITVEDSGGGIPKKELEKIFDPGYTTKSRGVGTGLGLAISYQIMEEHKGSIEVDSKPGKWTEIRLRFPTGN